MNVRKNINGEWVDLREDLCSVGDRVVSIFSVQDHSSLQDVLELKKQIPKNGTAGLKAVTAFGGDSND